MATKTNLGFKKPSTAELVMYGAEVISDNAQKADDLFTAQQDAMAAAQAAQAKLASRLGQAEANINAGNGNGPGLVADPDHPGFYFVADDSPLMEDPDNPGFYTF